MKTRLVQIGNSRGIRLPKTVLAEAQLEDEGRAESGARMHHNTVFEIAEDGLGRGGPKNEGARRRSPDRARGVREIRPGGMEVAVSRRFLRGDVCLIQLDPTPGSENRKTRPCLVISPDELNEHLRTLIVAPMTTGGQATRGA